MAHLLFIVSRNEPGFFEYLKRNFGDVGEVIFDRRVGERRQEGRSGAEERRRHRIDEELETTGWVIVRVGE